MEGGRKREREREREKEVQVSLICLLCLPALTVSMRFLFCLLSSVAVVHVRPSVRPPPSLSDSATTTTMRASVYVCALLTRMQIRHARTHSRARSTPWPCSGAESGGWEGGSRQRSVGLSRSTELRLLPSVCPSLSLLSLLMDSQLPPEPPNHVDRLGLSTGAYITSAARAGALPFRTVLHYTTHSLTHSHSV